MSQQQSNGSQVVNYQIDDSGFRQLLENFKASMNRAFHQIDNIDNSIDRIKNEKTTIKEIYHETITNVDHYNNSQLDSFFTNRYQ